MFFAGQKLTALIMNSAAPTGSAQTTPNTTGSTTTSTAYTATLASGSSHTLAFVAPPSGSIWVTYVCSAFHSATDFPSMSVGIGGAAGTIAPSTLWQAFNQTVTTPRPEHTLFRRYMFTGLVPGAAGLITMYYKTLASGTATFNNRQLAWEPVAA
jgi:hypothetical protein